MDERDFGREGTGDLERRRDEVEARRWRDLLGDLLGGLEFNIEVIFCNFYSQSFKLEYIHCVSSSIYSFCCFNLLNSFLTSDVLLPDPNDT